MFITNIETNYHLVMVTPLFLKNCYSNVFIH